MDTITAGRRKSAAKGTPEQAKKDPKASSSALADRSQDPGGATKKRKRQAKARRESYVRSELGTIRKVQLDLAVGDESDVTILHQVNCLGDDPCHLLTQAESGRKEAISDLLHAMAAKLEAREELHPDEAAFLASSLLYAAQDVRKYGWPFGYQAPSGRPAKLTDMRALSVGLAIDKVHRPQLYQRKHVPLTLEEAYAQFEAQSDVSERTVRRAYERFRDQFPGGAPSGYLWEIRLSEVRKKARAQLEEPRVERPAKR